MDSSVPIDLTGTNAKVTDSTGSASFELNGSNISGTAFTVDNNLVFLEQGQKQVIIDGKTYQVNSASGAVSITTDGTIKGLVNGTKITTSDNHSTVVMEVKNGLLTVTETLVADGTVLTASYKQDDSSVPFTVSYPADAQGSSSTLAEKLIVTGQSTDSSETADMTKTGDIRMGSSGNSGQVTTIVDGMQIDRNGNATTDRSKAAAKLTLQDDGETIKYEKQTDSPMTVEVGQTDPSHYSWDINTGKGSDEVKVNSTKDVKIDAGYGRNNIEVSDSGDSSAKSGSGSALVEVEGGNNRLTHTGTGESTLKGGRGNDTFKSNNESDTIIMGEGSNTLEMTAGVTNTISDYEYGKDKLKTATTKGPLALSDLHLSSNGIISYGTGDGAAKVGDDGQEYCAATLTDADGNNKVNVGWTGEEGGKIDATGQTEKVVLIGNPNGKKDTLMGGQAGDTIKAGKVSILLTTFEGLNMP